MISRVRGRVQDLQLRDRAGGQNARHGHRLERMSSVRMPPSQLVRRLVKKKQHDGESARSPGAVPVVLVHIQLGQQVQVGSRTPTGSR